MKIGVFNLIPWSYLDQRPQMVARMCADWGHETIYFETFSQFKYWDDRPDHPFEEYQKLAWNFRRIGDRLTVVNPFFVSAHKRFQGIYHRNLEFDEVNIQKIRELGLDLAIVNEPRWGPILHRMGIPFIYDHVDDTHHMSHVIKEKFFQYQKFCDEHSIKNIFIQPQIARRQNGIYIPNGISPQELNVKVPEIQPFDGSCLSAIADWFDMDSVLNSKKRLLIIGPMEADNLEVYSSYRRSGGRNVLWVPRVSRSMGAKWLVLGQVGIVPFNEGHGVVDYVMPLKIIEYLYLGLPAVSYVNKALEELFGDHIHFYSPSNWLGNPALDEAIERASNDQRRDQKRRLALNYTWERVMAPLKLELETVQNTLNLKNREKVWGQPHIQAFQ